MIEVENTLNPKRKKLLHTLRENYWELIELDEEGKDWVFDCKWIIESRREHYGMKVFLYFFLNGHQHEEIDEVVAAYPCDAQPEAYSSEGAMDFRKGKFERDLNLFIERLQELRTRI